MSGPSEPLHAGGYKRRSARARAETFAGPNMTPMVDVVMVILIFFMASAALLGPEWFVRTNLPKLRVSAAGAGQAVPTRVEVVLEAAQGAEARADIRIDGEKRWMGVSLEACRGALASIVLERGTMDVVVLVEAGEQVAYEDVVSVHAACHALGITRVGLGKPEEKK
jgi:biopolymer transport protein ExbD